MRKKYKVGDRVCVWPKEAADSYSFKFTSLYLYDDLDGDDSFSIVVKGCPTDPVNRPILVELTAIKCKTAKYKNTFNMWRVVNG